MTKRPVRVYLDFMNTPQEQRLRQILPGACHDPQRIDRHAEVAFENIAASADIIVTDRPGAFDGLEPQNGQLFVIAYRHQHHSLPAHFREVEPGAPIRKLVKIVREKYQSNPTLDLRTDRDPETVEMFTATTE